MHLTLSMRKKKDFSKTSVLTAASGMGPLAPAAEPVTRD